MTANVARKLVAYPFVQKISSIYNVRKSRKILAII